MASLTGTSYLFGFAAGSGNREDVLDMVVNIDPYDTPWVTMAPKVECKHTTHEWLNDTLAAVSTAGAQEGSAFGGASLTPRTRITNVTQIFRKDIEVTDTQRVLSPFGIQDEYGYQVLKATRELARNIESRVFAASGGSNTGSTGVVRVMKNLADYITSNKFKTSSILIGGSGGTASATNISEIRFNRTLEKIYTNGGNPDAFFVGPPGKRQVSSFGGASGSIPAQTLNMTAAGRSITRAIDTYASDYGLINVVLDRFVPRGTASASNDHGGTAALAGSGFFLERNRCRLAFLRPIKHVPMGKAADSTRGILLGELTLEVLAEKGSGMLTQISDIA